MISGGGKWAESVRKSRPTFPGTSGGLDVTDCGIVFSAAFLDFVHPHPIAGNRQALTDRAPRRKRHQEFQQLGSAWFRVSVSSSLLGGYDEPETLSYQIN